MVYQRFVILRTGRGGMGGGLTATSGTFLEGRIFFANRVFSDQTRQ